jgi:cell division protein FtsB
LRGEATVADLDSNKLYEFLRERARSGQRTTPEEVANRFGVAEGAAGKRLSLLAGNCILRAMPDGDFDCSNVLVVTAALFESAGSQGKNATAFVQSLLDDIKRLNENNAKLRAKVDELSRR